MQEHRSVLQERMLLLSSMFLFIAAIASLFRLSFGTYLALGLILVGIFAMLLSASMRDHRLKDVSQLPDVYSLQFEEDQYPTQ